MPIDVKSDEKLILRLRQAAKHVLSKEELRRQRVSFIYGNLPKESTISRNQIEAALSRIEGETA